MCAAIAWETIEHAYGSAAETPALLKGVAGGDKKALKQLMEAFAHQAHGTPGLPLLASALVELLPATTTNAKAAKLRPELLIALADCAAGGDHHSIVEGAVPGYVDFPEVQACRAAVVVGLPAIIEGLADDKANVRAAAALTLAMLAPAGASSTSAAEAVVNALVTWLPGETDASAAASGWLAVGQVGALARMADDVVAAARKHKKAQVPLAVAIATLMQAPTRDHADALLESMFVDNAAVPWCGGELKALAIGLSVQALSQAGAVDTLLALMPTLGVHEVLPAVVFAAFRHRRGDDEPDEPVLPSSLTGPQRQILRFVVERQQAGDEVRTWPLERVGVKNAAWSLGDDEPLTTVITFAADERGERGEGSEALPLWAWAIRLWRGRLRAEDFALLLSTRPAADREALIAAVLSNTVDFQYPLRLDQPHAQNLDDRARTHLVKVTAAACLDDDSWRRLFAHFEDDDQASLVLLHAAVRTGRLTSVLNVTVDDDAMLARLSAALDQLHLGPEPKRDVVAALPLPTRVALAAETDFDLLCIEDSWWAREGFGWADLGPSDVARDAALAALAETEAPAGDDEQARLVTFLRAFFAPFGGEGTSGAAALRDAINTAADNAEDEAMGTLLRAVATPS